MWGRHDKSLGLDSKNMELKWKQKAGKLPPEVNTQPVLRSVTNQPLALDQSCRARKPCHQLVRGNSVGQGTRQRDQMDKKAVFIRKEGKRSMNRDEGSYTQSHVYDKALATLPPDRGKNQKKNWFAYFFWWRSLIEIETSRLNNFLIASFMNGYNWMDMFLTLCGITSLTPLSLDVCSRVLRNVKWEPSFPMLRALFDYF